MTRLLDFRDLIQSLRYAFRRLLKYPTSTLVAVFAMAFGIGLTTSMFSIIDGVFLRGLPFDGAERVMHLERNHLERNITSMEVTQHDFEDWVAQQKSFEALAAYFSGTANLSDSELPERYQGAWISPGFLRLLRVQPHLGRAFSPADAEPGAADVILIGHHVWQKRYGSDPAIIGKTIRVNAEATSIIGVLPPGFRFPVDEDVWLPLQLETADHQRGEGQTLEVIGRLNEGVGLDQAGRELQSIAQRLAAEYPETNEGIGSVLKPYIEEIIDEETRQLLGIMFIAVVLVLLIACFNVTNLFIARASLRARELAVRSALGAGRWRAIGQVLAESTLVALAGAGLGLLLAHFALRLFNNAIALTDPPFWFDIYLSGRVLLVAVGTTAIAALAAGLLPALQASRPNFGHMLQDAGRGSTSFRMGWISRALVVAEVALSCALLVGAGLTVRSIVAANSYDLRFDPEKVLIARAGLFEGDYPEDSDSLAFFDDVRTRLASRAEVLSAAIGTVAPTESELGAGGTNYERTGETYERQRDMPWARLTVVSPGYFETFGLKLLAGRDFTKADRQGVPTVAIVNEDFARKEWPGENPIGKRINRYMGDEEEEKADVGWVEVVGLAPNLRFAEFDNADDQQGIYVPLAQNPRRFAWIIVKTRNDPLQFAEPLRRTVLEVDPDLPLYFVSSMNQVIGRTLFFPNLIAVLFSIFGLVAVILACVGLYGVMAFAVTRRTQEMGVRMALGAGSRKILGLVLGQGLRQVLLGLVVGLGLGALLGKSMTAFLYQIRAEDPVTFLAVPSLLIAVAILACWLPARRASRVDPLEALRHD